MYSRIGDYIGHLHKEAGNLGGHFRIVVTTTISICSNIFLHWLLFFIKIHVNVKKNVKEDESVCTENMSVTNGFWSPSLFVGNNILKDFYISFHIILRVYVLKHIFTLLCFII